MFLIISCPLFNLLDRWLHTINSCYDHRTNFLVGESSWSIYSEKNIITPDNMQQRLLSQFQYRNCKQRASSFTVKFVNNNLVHPNNDSSA